MRTRSSRFFVILLHLVGVSHPSWWMISSDTGIIAVLPWPVALERVDLYTESRLVLDDNDEGGVGGGGTRRRRRALSDEDEDEDSDHRRRRPTLLSTSSSASTLSSSSSVLPPAVVAEEEQPPLWLQDTSDGSCLGPTGTFSECGDATLWFVERRKLPASNKLTLLSGGLGRAATKGPSTGFTFQVVDRDYRAASVPASSLERITGTRGATGQKRETRRQRRERHKRSECLDADSSQASVGVQSCRRRGGFVWQPKVRSSVWILNEDGILQPASKRQDDSSLCLARGNGSEAILADCDKQKPVQFSFLRYRAVAVPASTVVDGVSPMDEVLQAPANNEGEISQEAADPTDSAIGASSPSPSNASSSLPVNRDLARSQASEPAMHPELKISSGLLFGTDHRKPMKSSTSVIKGRPFDLLSDTNPILLAGGKNADKKRRRITPPPSASLPLGSVDDNSAASKIRRMQRHPYLNEAKDGIWTCPLTGLEYQTDLHKYLGWKREECGRHTLTGVGLYRKGFVIKVYGIAFYVSKRDVLAESSFKPYASLTVDQLRARPDFYGVLRSRESVFDRTILLKTNMQIATETMRSSLQADWTYLTDEAKGLLVDSSTEPRLADDTMLRIIQSHDNPSHCSCSQVAPVEYNANPECCARGTELGFTWTKANELEVRLNGRLMETFARPDIAEGIFYEYLRSDDPISPELRDRLVDGFPFLLGPLAQVRGVNIGKSASPKVAAHDNAFLPLIDKLSESVRSLGTEMVRTVAVIAESAGNATKELGEAAKDLSIELDRRRDSIIKHTVAAPVNFAKLLMRDPETTESITNWLAGFTDKAVAPETPPEEVFVAPTRRAPRGRVFGYPVSRWFGEDFHAPDEIGPMKIHPTINKIILALVHLYLLLLFIVSFPGSYSARTKLVVRRSCRENSDSESDTSEESGKVCLEELTNMERQRRDNRRTSQRRRNLLDAFRTTRSEDLPDETPSDSRLKKKSLSYFL